MIHHLLSAAAWAVAQVDGRIVAESLDSEGFLHCTGDLDTLLDVANRFYTGVVGAMVVAGIDESRLTVPVRWEAPAHPDGSPTGEDEPRFPHVYGPVPTSAVVELRVITRADDGRFTGYEER